MVLYSGLKTCPESPEDELSTFELVSPLELSLLLDSPLFVAPLSALLESPTPEEESPSLTGSLSPSSNMLPSTLKRISPSCIALFSASASLSFSVVTSVLLDKGLSFELLESFSQAVKETDIAQIIPTIIRVFFILFILSSLKLNFFHTHFYIIHK